MDANDADQILDNSVYDVVEDEVDDQLDPNVSEYGPTPPRKYWTNRQNNFVYIFVLMFCLHIKLSSHF